MLCAWALINSEKTTMHEGLSVSPNLNATEKTTTITELEREKIDANTKAKTEVGRWESAIANIKPGQRFRWHFLSTFLFLFESLFWPKLNDVFFLLLYPLRLLFFAFFVRPSALGRKDACMSSMVFDLPALLSFLFLLFFFFLSLPPPAPIFRRERRKHEQKN